MRLLIIVTKHNGSIVRARGINWPASLYENRTGTNRLSELVWKIVRVTWSADFDESEEKRVVGTAAGYKVKRNVTISTRPERDGMDTDD